MKKEEKGLDIYHYIRPDYLPANPFKLDLRYTSNYVPREVRDHLNLIMDRPRSGDFLPILPVAFLALQLASQYLVIRQKTEITVENVVNTKEALPVLEALWIKSPLTLTELYERQRIQDSQTMRNLERLIALLIENNLVKTRLIENDETKYFPALTRTDYQNLAQRQEVPKLEAELNIRMEMEQK